MFLSDASAFVLGLAGSASKADAIWQIYFLSNRSGFFANWRAGPEPCSSRLLCLAFPFKVTI